MPKISVPWDYSLSIKPIYPVLDFASDVFVSGVSAVRTPSGRILFSYIGTAGQFNTGGYTPGRYYLFTSYSDSLSDIVGDGAPSDGGANGRTVLMSFPSKLEAKVTGNFAAGTAQVTPPSARLFVDNNDTYLLVSGFEPSFNPNLYGTFILRDTSSSKNGSGPWVYHSTVASITINDSIGVIDTDGSGSSGQIAVLDNGDWVTVANINYRTPLPGPLTLSGATEPLQAVVADLGVLRSTNKGASWSVTYSLTRPDNVIRAPYHPDWPDIEAVETLPQPDPTTVWASAILLGERETNTGELIFVRRSVYRYDYPDVPSSGQTTYGAGVIRGQLVSLNSGASWFQREAPYTASSPLNVTVTNPFDPTPSSLLSYNQVISDHGRWYWIPAIEDSVGDWVFEFVPTGGAYARRATGGPFASTANQVPHIIIIYGSPTNLGTGAGPQLVTSAAGTGFATSALQHLMRTGDVVSGGWLTGAVGWR